MKRHVSFIAICMLLCLALTGCGSKAIEEGTTYLEDGNYKKAVTTSYSRPSCRQRTTR